MNTVAIINAVLELINALGNAVGARDQITALLGKMLSEGRTTLTPEEWASIDAQSAAADQALSNAAKP